MNLFNVSVVVVLLVGLWGCGQSQLECLDGFTTCAASMDAASAADSSIDATCKAVDEMLICMEKETTTCDPIMLAELGRGTMATIESFQNPPYNCSLPSASNPLYNPDDCANALSECNAYFIAAQFSNSYQNSCSNFETYVECMKTNATTACQSDVSRLTFVQQKANETSASMNDHPFYCQERKTYDLEGCDEKFHTCFDNFVVFTINKTADDTQQVCQAATTMEQCVEPARPLCSPRRLPSLEGSVWDLVMLASSAPFHCRQDDQCVLLFTDCTNTEAATVSSAPCGQMEIFNTCLSRMTSRCNATQFSDLEAKVKAEIDAIDKVNQCTYSSTTSSATPTSSAVLSSSAPSASSVSVSESTNAPSITDASTSTTDASTSTADASTSASGPSTSTTDPSTSTADASTSTADLSTSTAMSAAPSSSAASSGSPQATSTFARLDNAAGTVTSFDLLTLMTSLVTLTLALGKAF